MEKILFYHGGPGLNGNPARNLLAPLYKSHNLELIVWDEPSALRGTLSNNSSLSRFEQLLHSAEIFLLEHYRGAPVCLMGSSMGCQVIAWLLQKHADKVKRVIFSGPCFHIDKADLNIFSSIASDYSNNGNDTTAKQLQDVIKHFSGKFDARKISGWQLVLANPRLLNYYWHNPSWMNRYLECFTPPDYALDIESFFAVRKSMTALVLQKHSVSTLVLYGAHDRIITAAAEQMSIQARFPNHENIQLEQSGHYPHIEEAEKVLEAIEKLIGSDAVYN